MKPILEIQNVSKKFRIHHENQPYLSLRDSLASVFKKSKNSSEEFYALNDVSFNVNPGESIGIIGKNGAGKSTLLKILSKITPPSSGKIVSRGRVASLLEVGTGFHPELSGRENIFLNGSILGMKQKEILAKFDEIVDFSGTEKFLDTPLKRYSSGMQLRLAFSVAAFLEPEILVIDEVLAVGDIEFQKKCIGKMEDVSKSGRTILFVSHNLYALQSLCHLSVLLSNGQLLNKGNTSDIIEEYLKLTMKETRSFNETIEISPTLQMSPIIVQENSDATLTISLILKTNHKDTISALCIFINNIYDSRIGIFDCRNESFPLLINSSEEIKLSIITNLSNIVEGEYKIGLYIETNSIKGNINNYTYYQKRPKMSNELKVIKYSKEYRGIIDFENEVIISRCSKFN